MEKIIETYNFSRETFQKLKTYEASLSEWQNKFNLVSKKSLENAWQRHFLDSLQLIKYIPDDSRTLYDFGSGAGFPGMVSAIAENEQNPILNISLIESVTKKTRYFQGEYTADSSPAASGASGLPESSEKTSEPG